MFSRKISSKKRKVFILILVVSVLFVFFNIFQQGVRNFVYVISSPFQRVLWRAGDRTSDFFRTFIKINKINKETKKLKEDNQELTAEIAALKELREENKNLREALNIDLQKDFKLSFVEVIGKDISQDFILINKGTKDGVLKNMPVITPQKILLGKIENLYENFSKVMLLSNKSISFDVRIQDSGDISGVGKGGGNSKILVDFIPWEKNISKGDIVVSDSLGGIFPKGLLIGRVDKVEKNDVDVSQKIEVDPAFNIKELSTLFIIIGQK